jgi:GNAT superfamily N-acetyltransferase
MISDGPAHHAGTVDVRVVRPADAADAAAVLARAFDQEPTLVTIVPDPAARRALLELTMGARLFDPLRYGTVHGAWLGDDLGGVAVWYPPGAPKLSLSGALSAVLLLPTVVRWLARALPRTVRVFSSDIRGAADLFRRRRRAMARAVEGLTWRLDLLGTVPSLRGKGIARALLDRQLRRCDQDGAAVWLEATDPVNPKIYQRFGFETLAHIDGPSWLLGYWVMRRQPRAGAGAPPPSEVRRAGPSPSADAADGRSGG